VEVRLPDRDYPITQQGAPSDTIGTVTGVTSACDPRNKLVSADCVVKSEAVAQTCFPRSVDLQHPADAFVPIVRVKAADVRPGFECRRVVIDLNTARHG